jgi:LPS-assembly protein
VAATISLPVHAQESPVDFEADTVTVDEDKNVLIAKGNVRLTQAGDLLTADKIIYNRATDDARAIGNVIYLTSDGFEHRAGEMELSKNFTHAIATPMISFFSDGSRVDASRGELHQGAKSIFDNSRFSPCKCDYDNGESPIWDLRSLSSSHNPETQTVVHQNVSMHIFGLPIFYFPVITHADWTVKRRSGLLSPTIQYSNDLGSTLKVPYYQVLGPTKDVEIQATSFKLRGQGIKTIYRHRWNEADLNAEMVLGKLDTYSENRQNVAAIDARFKSRIGDGWNISANVERSSQDTFLRRYGYHNSQRLNSAINATKIDDNRYYRVLVSDMQGLATTDTEDDETTILPSVFYEKRRAGFTKRQKITTQLSALQLDNDEAHEMTRWTGLAQLEDKVELAAGVLNGSFAILGTYYDIQSNNTSPDQTSEFGQLNALVSTDFRLPFAVQLWNSPISFEPRIQATLITGSDRTDEVPNRDSSDFRLDEANIFLPNQFQGQDYTLPGSHIDTGVTALSSNNILGDVTAFAGISYRSSGKTPSGLTAEGSEKYSDYVASVRLKTPYNIDVSWSGRASSSDLDLNESNASFDYNNRNTSISVVHKQIAKAYFSAATDDREEASFVLKQKVVDDVTFIANQTWDLSASEIKRNVSSYSLLWAGGFQDCITVSLDYKRDPFSDRDVKDVEELQFLINFKYLGALPQIGY